MKVNSTAFRAAGISVALLGSVVALVAFADAADADDTRSQALILNKRTSQ